MTVTVVIATPTIESKSEEGKGEEEEENKGDEERHGIKRLAQAIERFEEAYERLEIKKLRQILDLEKQRMKFTRD